MTSPAAGRGISLAVTPQGQSWLEQFEPEDRGLARELLGSITLVSGIEFERRLVEIIERRADIYDGAIALYAVREVVKGSSLDYFEQASGTSETGAAINAVPGGSDLGSEVRVAAAIRNLARSSREKYLNHPNIDALRAKKPRAIFLVDDLVASGDRTFQFLDAIWRNRSIRSWHSFPNISFEVIAYSAVTAGERKVIQHRAQPNVTVERYCPTLVHLPWKDEKRKRAIQLCEKYGKRTSRPRLWDGYGETMALLVFEHGCPNNTPSMLWAPENPKVQWKPLFPDRSVVSGHRAAFPPEISSRKSTLALIEMDQARLAAARISISPRPLSDEALMILALLQRHIRDLSAWSHSTGMSARACSAIVETLIESGFVLATLRLSDEGRRELAAMAIVPNSAKAKVPSLGEDEYYPHSLRSHIAG